MTLRVSRALLQVLYLEQHAAPRTPNTLRELLGLMEARAAGEATPPKRKTLDLHGAAHFADDPLRRVTALNMRGDVVISPPTISSNQANYRPDGWDDASLVLLSVSGTRELYSFDAFSCTCWEKLVINKGPGTVTVHHNSNVADTFIDNRVLNPGNPGIPAEVNIELLPGAAVWLLRDFTLARWRCKKVGVGATEIEIDLDFSNEDKSMHQVTVGNL